MSRFPASKPCLVRPSVVSSFRWQACLLAAVVPVLFAAVAGAADPAIPRTPRPEAARVYFISPKAGEKLKSPIVVRFGLEQMGIAPAGVAHAHTGHHHLIVDAELPPAALPVPKSEHYLHFGGGQTEIRLELAPGPHTLQLMLGDHNHVPHDPPVVSERITIEIVK
jgi:hypothetical protein